MLYRIPAIFALLFFAACMRAGEPAPIRKSANEEAPADMAMAAPVTPVTPAVPVQPAEPMAKSVKVALLVPLSGEAAPVGNALRDAAALAFMDKYGYAEVNGTPVKLVLMPKDTGGTPQGAAKAAQEVLNKGAQFIVGPLMAPEVQAVAPIARSHGVGVLSFSNNPSVAGQGVYVFGFRPGDQVRRVLDFALLQNKKRIAFLLPKTPYGAEVLRTASDFMKVKGVEPAFTAQYDASGAAGAEILELVNAHRATPFDAILIPEGGAKLITIASALKAQGIQAPAVALLGAGSWDEPNTLRNPAIAGGWFASTAPDSYMGFETRFREYFGYAPSRIASLSYDAMALVANLGLSSDSGQFNQQAITDQSGYNGPINGLFRCGQDGKCERGLPVMEAGPTGARIIDVAPNSF